MMYIILERLSRTWAKNGLVSQRWRYFHQMNWWNESIEGNTYENFKKKNLIHKYKVSNEKDLDFSDGDALHRFFYRL